MNLLVRALSAVRLRLLNRFAFHRPDLGFVAWELGYWTPAGGMAAVRIIVTSPVKWYRSFAEEAADPAWSVMQVGPMLLVAVRCDIS